MPTGATPGVQMSIGVLLSYEGTGLRAPTTGLPAGTKVYPYASISELPGLNSATGVGELGTIAAGQVITLPTTTVNLLTKSDNEGIASVRPGAMNFGTSPGAPFIQCRVLNATALQTYPLTVSGGGQSASSTPSPTVTATAAGTDDETADETTDGDIFEDESGMETPVGAAETGGGGDAGPDGRMLVGTGLLIILAAGSGLLLHRRGTSVRPRSPRRPGDISRNVAR
ncbi:hypothetical protein GCM10010160_43650 [Acrocarpospora corrugata]